PIDSNKIIQLVEKKYQTITHFELYQSFFSHDLDKDSSLEFLRKVLYENTVYFPIYYYLVKASISNEHLDEILSKEKGSKISDFKHRISTEKNDREKFITGNIQSDSNAATSIKAYLKMLEGKNVINIKELESLEIRYLISAITHLDFENVDNK